MYTIRPRSHHSWRRVVVALVLVVVALSGLIVWWQTRPAPTISFRSSAAEIAFAYDQHLSAARLSSDDSKQRVILRLTNARKTTPPLQLTVRYESGLKPIVAVAKQDLREALKDSIDKNYPARFKDYKLIARRDFDVESHKASEVTFTYTGPSGETIKQRFVLVVVSDDKATYVAAQSKASDFDKLNQQYFEPLVHSLRSGI